MRRIALLLLATCGLAGCGDFYWDKPGATNSDFQRDTESCRKQSPVGQWEACMKSRGWSYSAGW